MENGFIVDITNSTSIVKEVKLFTSPLPDGISVSTMDKVYNFSAIQSIAQKNIFIGNTLTTNSDEAIQIEIVGDKQKENITLKGRYERPEIKINGNDEFISIMCPPNSNFYIRLNSLPPEII